MAKFRVPPVISIFGAIRSPGPTGVYAQVGPQAAVKRAAIDRARHAAPRQRKSGKAPPPIKMGSATGRLRQSTRLRAGVVPF
jgi:hypothetical protein